MTTRAAYRHSNRHYSRFQSLLAGLLLCTCVLNARAVESVDSLRYGVTLFHFYQQDYFNALTELMAAQQMEQLGSHVPTAELLRGGMSLSYGMDRIAESIFRDLLSDSGEEVDRDQAWFYLGKMAWQRGQVQRSSAALTQMSAQYDGELATEADYLRASIALYQSDEQAAVSYLERLPRDSLWRYYLYYNFGAGKAAGGEWSQALTYFGEFEKLPLADVESRALQDKAFTAAGFTRMTVEDFQGARSDFSNVRLQGPLSDRALLGYGWAAARLEDYEQALSPWQLLGQRSMLGESARESLLALPYAYEQLQRPGLAMDGYVHASQLYSAQLDGLRQAIEVFRSEDLRPLLALEDNSTGDWLFDGDILPQGEYAPYLQYLVKQHRFQVALRELRDLYSIAGHLGAARERLQVLGHVDQHQQQVWSSVEQGQQRDQLQQRQRSLAQQIGELRRQLDQAEAAQDSRVLADTEQRAHWARLDRATELGAVIQASEEQERKLALLRGLMIWEDNENYPARVWRVRRQVEELEALALQSLSGLQSVESAIAQRHHSNFAARIEALQKRVRNQASLVERAISAAQSGVRQVAVAELERQAGQLTRDLGRTELAIARLYDQASPEIAR